MGSIDFYGAIHIKWWQTSKETIADMNADALADPGGTAGVYPYKGPDSFVLTYKFYET